MDGVGGYRAWRWIFLLEGAATVLIGILAFLIIPDWPETAKFLKQEERALLLSTLHEDSGPAVMNRLDKKAMKRAFSDWKIYLGLVLFFIMFPILTCRFSTFRVLTRDDVTQIFHVAGMVSCCLFTRIVHANSPERLWMVTSTYAGHDNPGLRGWGHAFNCDRNVV